MHSLASTQNIKPTLEDVLNNETSYPYSLDDFTTFLDQTFCLENLEFWSAVKKYRYYASNFYDSGSLVSDISGIPEIPEDYCFEDVSLRGDGPAHLEFLKQKLLDLLTTFILPNSPKEVNILSAIRDDLLTNVFQYNNFHPSVLDPARYHVFELMQASSFSQFLLEAGNTELRMSEDSGVDSDYSSSSGVSFRGITRSVVKNRTRHAIRDGLKQKYRKLIKKN